MNRRRFIAFAACAGCGWALAGCERVRQQGGDAVAAEGEAAMSDRPAAQAIDKADWDISVCGLNCARCKLLAQDKCGGCRGPIDENWSPDCTVRPCAEARGHTYCFECAELPCEKLEAFAADGYKHHRLAVEKLKAMKKVGLEAWIARQDRPRFCPGWRF